MSPIRLILFLAWRNVLRYRKRTIQCFLILCIGAFSIMLVDAFMKGYAANAQERIVAQTGNLDVHAAGYLDSAEAMPLDLAIDDTDAVMSGMLETASRHVSAGVRPLVTPTVVTGCMLSNGEASRTAMVVAAEAYARSLPGGDARVNPLLADASASMVAGHFYGKQDEGGAILDAKYALKLGLGPGDPVILLGNDAYGSFSMMETTVIGIAREASLPGEAGCVVDLAGFSPVFGLEGRATGLSFWFATERDGRLLPGSAEGPAAQAVLDSLASMPALEPRAFSEISASYTAMFEFLDIFMAGMMAIFGIVASVGIANAILLSVQERTRDLGTLRAIALTSRQAGMLVQAETLITGIAAALCSLVLGLLVIWLAERTGVGMRIDISEVGAALPETLRPRLYPGRLAAIAAMTAIFPVLAAMLPSAMVRKLTIRESLGS